MPFLLSMPGGSEWILILMVLLFPLWALVDIVRSNFVRPENKIVWILLVIFLPFVGSILYLVFGKNQKSAA